MRSCTAVPPPGSYPLTFLVNGVEPPEYEWMSQADRFRFWSIVGVIAERVKQFELQKGLDRHGRKLKPVRYRKIRFRRSGRIVDGEPLMPHRGLSRTRRLLQFTITAMGVLFYWQNGWARILDYHRRGACLRRNGRIVGKLPVRDVFGISPAGMDVIRRESLKFYRSGSMPKKKIAGSMTDQGLGIELPFDQITNPVNAGKPRKLTQDDFLAMGVRVARSAATTRTANTATSVTGAQGTGLRITVDWKKPLPWKSKLNSR